MKNGYYIACPGCGTHIEDFSLADEWFCDCGEQGVIEYPYDEDDDAL